MKLINLTPHAITVCGREIPPSGQVARCAVEEEVVGMVEHPDSDDQDALTTSVPIIRQVFGEVTGLPERQDGVMYVVSAIVAQAVPDRVDVVIPARTLRDEAGRIVGCEALATVR